jgi:hypothetical protein
MNRDFKTQRVVVQQLQHKLAISHTGKDRLVVIAPLDHMVRVAWDSKTGQAGHGFQNRAAKCSS